ncbi:MAG: RHS repeat domain-containing protein [Acidobacteriota bacterium]
MTLNIASFAPSISGQVRTPDRGDRLRIPFAESGLDKINLANGNLFISIPIASLPKGRGDSPDFSVYLNYNSKLWNLRREIRTDGSEGEDGSTAYAADLLVASKRGGWSLGLAYRLETESRADTEPAVPCNGQRDMQKNAYLFKTSMVFPDGSEHEFVPVGYESLFSDGFFNVTPNGERLSWAYSTVGEGSGSCRLMTTMNASEEMYYRSTDGSRINLVIHRSPSGLANRWAMYFPDGRLVENLSTEPSALHQRITDRNGNMTTLRQMMFEEQSSFVVEDAVGRKTIVKTTPYGQSVITFGFAHERIETQIEWRTNSFERIYNAVPGGTLNAPLSLRSQPLSANAMVVSEIRMPTQLGPLAYRFEYSAENSPSPSGWGELSAMTLPSGARLEYRYQLDLTTPINSAEIVSNSITSRTSVINEGSDVDRKEIRESQIFRIGDGTSQVVAPDGGLTEYGFVRQDSSDCQAGRSLYIRYPDGKLDELIWTEGCESGYVAAEISSLPNARGIPVKSYAVKSVEDGEGNLLERCETPFFDYSAIERIEGRPVALPPGVTQSRCQKNLPAPHSDNFTTRLRNRILISEVVDGAGQAVARTEFRYDNPYTTGNLIQTKRWNSAAGTLRPGVFGSDKLDFSNAIVDSATYDGFGNVTSKTDGRGFVTEYVYREVEGVPNLYPTRITSASRTSVELSREFEYDLSTASVISETLLGNSSEENIVTTRQFDPLGRETLRVEAQNTPDERHVSTRYDSVTRKIETRSDLRNASDGMRVSSEFFDQLGRRVLSEQSKIVSSGVFSSAPERRTTQFRYMRVGGTHYSLTSNAFKQGGYSSSDESPSGWVLNEVSQNGHFKIEKRFEGAEMPFPFGGNKNVKGTTTSYSYVNWEVITDASDRTKVLVRNPQGQPAEMWDVTESGEATVDLDGFRSFKGDRTLFFYDANKGLREVRQGAQRRIFVNDSLGRVASVTLPESGTTTNTYDQNDNLVKSTDARGISTVTVYDALNRPVHRNYSSGASESSYVPSPPEYFSYDDYRVRFSRGKLTRINSAVSDERITAYDAMGRVTSNIVTVDGVPSHASYRYDLAGNLIEQIYPSGRTVRTEHSDTEEVTNVFSRLPNEGWKLMAGQFNYGPAGELRRYMNGNGLAEMGSYDSAGNLTKLTVGKTQCAPLFVSELLYDLSDNLIGESYSLPHIAQRASRRYTYDSLDRLTLAGETIATTPQWAEAFLYDRWGNRRLNESLSTTISKNCLLNGRPSVCPADRKLLNPFYSPTTNRLEVNQDGDRYPDYIYDAAGNLVRDAELKSYSYDASNRLVQVNDRLGNPVAKYLYDAQGRRVSKTIFSEKKAISKTLYVYAPDERLIAEYGTTPPASSMSFVTLDQLGSARMMTDSAGRITMRSDYLSFGGELIRSSLKSVGTQKRFTGYLRDYETGLDFSGSRYYQPRFGRFMSVDPLLSSGLPMVPQSFNRYTYALNNPLRVIDPSGELWTKNTAGDRFKNPYVWVDSCSRGRECWTAVAFNAGPSVRIYGSIGAADITSYRVNNFGQIDMETLLAHHDSRVSSVARSQNIPETFLSSDAATALFNIGIRYREKFPEDSKLVFTNGNTSSGGPCVYPSGRPCHLGHRGNDFDLRYMGPDGEAIIGGSAFKSADPARNRFLIKAFRALGFHESFSGDSAIFGTNPASKRTERIHANHLHIGVFDNLVRGQK